VIILFYFDGIPIRIVVFAIGPALFTGCLLLFAGVYADWIPKFLLL